MKKLFLLNLIFCFLFSLVIISTTNSYAETNATFYSLITELGLGHLGHTSEKAISDLPVNSKVKCWVKDPSKMGVFQKSEQVKVLKLGNNKWEVNNPDTGGRFEFSVNYENGKLNVVETGSTIGEKPKPSIDLLNLQGRISVGARLSYVNYSDDDFSLFGIKTDTEPDDSVMFGVNGAYFFSNNFSIEFSADYVQTDIDIQVLGVSGKAGEISQIPLLLTGRFGVPINNRVMPYFGGGVGFFINDWDQEIGPPFFPEEDIDNSFGYLVNGGLDIFVTPNVALNVDAKYIWNRVEVDSSIPGLDAKFNLDMFVVGGGLKYYF